MMFARLLTLASLAVVAISSHAANECKATVTFVASALKGPGVELTFNVSTQCDRSTGQFEYTYESSLKPGVPLERRAPSWRAGDGKTFKLIDDLSNVGGSVISKVKVKLSTIESTKQ